MDYDFKHCKLCRQTSAEPLYQLSDSNVYCCKQCDFHFLDQLDSASDSAPEKNLSAASRRYIETRSDEGAHLHPSRFALLQNLAGTSPLKLLDIGAGLGQFQLLANRHGYETFGIEPSSLRRQYAREAFALELSDQLVDSDHWQTHYPEFFDLITLWDVIEHVNFPRETCAAALRLLKPGGILLLDTPSRNVLPYRLSDLTYRLSRGSISLFLPGFYSALPFGHKQIFTPKQLGSLLQELGLEIIHQAKAYPHQHKKDKIIMAAVKPPRSADQAINCPPLTSIT